MAFHVMETADDDKYKEAAFIVRDDSKSREESSEIDQKITMVQAEEMLEEWKRSRIEAEIKLAGKPKHELKENEEKLKEALFVKFGFDIDDIFEAFEFYGLKDEIHDEDRKIYKKMYHM